MEKTWLVRGDKAITIKRQNTYQLCHIKRLVQKNWLYRSEGGHLLFAQCYDVIIFNSAGNVITCTLLSLIS